MCKTGVVNLEKMCRNRLVKQDKVWHNYLYKSGYMLTLRKYLIADLKTEEFYLNLLM